MNKKRCHTLLPLVQLLPTVAVAAAVLFALPRTVPVLAAVPEKLTAVVEQPVEAASSEAEEETLPKLPYADGVYVGSSRGYGGAVRVQVTMENGSITEVEILDASHETKQFLRRAKRLLTTVVEAQSWEVDAVSEATYTSRGILGAVQNALTGASPWEVFSRLTALHLPPEGFGVGIGLLVLILLGMAVQPRFFCQFLCPMGAVFALLPVLPFAQLHRQSDGCIPGCNACKQQCPVCLKLEETSLRSGECIACEACVGTCPKQNIHRWDTTLCKRLWLPVLGKVLLFFLLGCWLGFCRFI